MPARTISRRTLLTGAGAGAALVAAQSLGWPEPERAASGATAPQVPEVAEAPGAAGSDLFTLGVASGDPSPGGVVLWTRLAPDPVHGGGMPDRDVDVEWEVAADERFRQVVQRGTGQARPELGHSVHVELDGLAPGAWYWYRFRSGRAISRVGRTRTAPAPGSSPNRVRFAFASCQSYTIGHYAAYRHLAAEDLDLVVHLGDYIYEEAAQGGGLRRHEGEREPRTLGEYRNRHALYRTDPFLQDAHAAFPFVLTWDDHEIDNNWAGAAPEDPDEQSRRAFRRRRRNAAAAYYEHMPLRRSALLRNGDLRLYRRLDYGDLAAFHVLDGRRHRTDQPCVRPGGRPRAPHCAERDDPAATMLGREQERWLHGGLHGSRARWNVLANQTLLAQFDFDPAGGRTFNTDHWDGYPVMRARLLELLRTAAVSNPVVITGDSHSSRVNDLRVDFDDPDLPVIGTEFAGTSITSAAAGADRVEAALKANPHVRFYDGDRRGYVRCELTTDQWRTDFRLLPRSSTDEVTVPSPDLDLSKTVTWIVPDGGTAQPG